MLSSSRFGRYRLLDRLGQGGTGVVYLAHVKGHSHPVAVKRIRPELAREPRFAAALADEARICARLDHPGIVRLLEVGRVRRELYLAMEYAPGRSLATLLAALAAAGETLPVALACHVAAEVAAALGYAHGRRDEHGRRLGIVHRDVNPSNVIVTPTGEVKLLDFGIATAAGHLRRAETGTGVVKGTLGYLSPEQAEGLPLDGRSDLFALGVVLYESLTGRGPFEGRTALHSLQLLGQHAPPPPSRLRPEIGAAVDAVVARLLARVPADRYATGEEAAAALDAVGARAADRAALGALVARLAPPRASSPQVTRRIARPQPRWRRARWLAGGAAALALGALGLRLVPRGSPSPAPPPAPARASAVEPERRLTLAVLGFRNLGQRAETTWISSALAEILTSELGRAGLRTLPSRQVERAKLQLGLGTTDALPAAALADLQRNLDVDLVLAGSYLALPSGQLRASLHIHAAQRAEVVASDEASGSETELYALAAAAATRLGAALDRRYPGRGRELAADAGDVRAPLPANAAALRLYTEGTERLERNEPAAARDLFERAVAADPKNALARLALATAWSRLGHTARAEAEAARAQRLAGPLSLEQRLVIKARAHAIAMNWAGAAEAYQTLFESFPDNLEYGIDLVWMVCRTGDTPQALVVLDRLRRLPAPMRDDPRIDAITAFITTRDLERSLRAAAVAKAKAHARGAKLLVAELDLTEAIAHLNAGNHAQAVRAAGAARTALEPAGQWAQVIQADNVVATSLQRRSDHAGALAVLERSLALATRIGDRRGEISLLRNAAHSLLRVGRPDEARARLLRALPLAREVDNHALIASTLALLARERQAAGRATEAMRLVEEAVALCRRSCARRLPGLLGQLAEHQLELGALALARQTSNEAVARGRLVSDPHELYQALSASLGVHRLAAASDAASRAAAESKRLAARFEWSGERAEADLALGRLALDAGELDTAADAARAVLEAAEKATIDAAVVLSAHELLARLALARKDPAGARDHLGAARARLAPGLSRLLALQLDLTRARVHAALAEPAAARQLVAATLAFAERHQLGTLALEARLAALEVGPRSRARSAALVSAAQRTGHVLLARQALALGEQPPPTAGQLGGDLPGRRGRTGPRARQR